MKPCLACGRSTSETARACEYCGSSLILPIQSNPALAQRVKHLVADGQKIEAIKLLREATGLGLAEAKQAVEAIASSEHLEPNELSAEAEGELLGLLQAGRKIEAIKRYREQHPCGLKEAKEFVEALAKQRGIVAPQGGCLGVSLALLIVFLIAATCVARAEEATISPGEKSPDGWITHIVESEYQAKPTEIRILVPDKLALKDRLDATQPRRVLYVLPVEAGRESKYGDGLAEVKRLDLHNKHGLICVAPTFAHLPWYADHPTDKTIRQESYFVKVVVPFIDRTYQLDEKRRMDASSVRIQAHADGRGVHPTPVNKESRWLLGFSKSGWGAWSLLARNPDLFGRAAAWDAPLDMPRRKWSVASSSSPRSLAQSTGSGGGAAGSRDAPSNAFAATSCSNTPGLCKYSNSSCAAFGCGAWRTTATVLGIHRVSAVQGSAATGEPSRCCAAMSSESVNPSHASPFATRRATTELPSTNSGRLASKARHQVCQSVSPHCCRNARK